MVPVRRHVLGAGHVHAAAADLARHPGVGLGDELAAGDGRHALDRLENRLRADRAVEPNDIGAEPVEATRDLVGRDAVGAQAIDADRHLRDDGHAGVNVACRENGLLDLVEIGERLDDEAVRAALRERRHLLPKQRARFVAARGAVGLDAHAERPDGARHEAVLAGGLARQLGRSPIELRDL